METSRNDDFDFEEEELLGLPPGVTFNPTDQHLVAYFLRNKIHGKQAHLLNIFIIDADVYASHPAVLPWGFHPGLTSSYRYYFSRRHKVSANCNANRPKRTVDCGWWRSDTGDKDIMRRGKVIGRKKTLSFLVYKDPSKKRKEAQKTGWIMHEYRLAEDSFQEWVLCKIYNKASKKNKNLEIETADSPISETTAILSEDQPESTLVETDNQYGGSDNTPQNVECSYREEDLTDRVSLFWCDNEQPESTLVETDYQYGGPDSTPQNVDERSHTEEINGWVSSVLRDNEQPESTLVGTDNQYGGSDSTHQNVDDRSYAEEIDWVSSVLRDYEQPESTSVETDHQYGGSDSTHQNVDERSYAEEINDWVSSVLRDNEQNIHDLQSY